jgi:hypothetical protein
MKVASLKSLGYIRDSINEAGQVFDTASTWPHDIISSRGRAKVKLYRFIGSVKKAEMRSVAELVAEMFYPKPAGATRLIHRDGDEMNCKLTNLLWVDDEDYRIPKDAVKVPEFPGIRVTRDGAVYRSNSTRFLRHKKEITYSFRGKAYGVSVARLVALAFLPKPTAWKTMIVVVVDKTLPPTPDNLAWMSKQEHAMYLKKLKFAG